MSETVVTHQPLPHEFETKYSLFHRLQDMARQMQKMRRAMGYVWLEGGVGVLEGVEETRVHVRQSGLIVVALTNPHPALHLEPVRVERSLGRFHREREAPFVVEYVWDEAMLATRQA